ncbi:MAG TPA: hypothetical protein VFA33_22920 [Bryobacteraceae bacterium]|nr:hypothetical protein [Bryobacteraceae bacterium]
MPGKSQPYSDAVLNVLRGTGITGVSPYLGLFSVAPADDNSAGTELAGAGYARQPVTFGAPVSDTGNVRKISNAANLQFGPASSDWLPAVAFGIFDAQTNGNLLYWNTLPTPKTIQMGDFGQFAPGSLVVEED